MNTTVDSKKYQFEKGQRVGVTGAGGFIGRHIVSALLREGVKVTATKRDLSNIGSLRADIQTEVNCEEDSLQFVAADLLSDDGWDTIFQGCDAVIHTASPFPSRPPKSPDELVETAEKGTERVMRAAHMAGVSRIIITSSVAAIMMRADLDANASYDETHWSDPDHRRADAYSLSKLRAEQKAWQLSEELGLELTVLNPGLVFGSPIGQSAGTSVGIIKRLFDGKDMALPDAGFPSVDVRDVAKAHVLALQSPDCIGERIALSQDTLAMVEMAGLLRSIYPSKRIPKSVATGLMVKTAARFDPELQTVLPFLGFHPKVSSSKARDLLNIEFRDVKESIVETAKGFV